MRSGWKTITVSGNAKQRGHEHGSKLASEISELLIVLPEELKSVNHMSLEDYICLSNKLARSEFDKCVEWREELEGMVEGALSKGVVVSVDFLFAWNMYHSISKKYYKKKTPHNHADHCSAFIATGEATKNGKIVMAHNTHTGFTLGRFYNIVQYVYPDKGHSFVMQTCPGSICSVVDWFICGSGIIGCETTIGNVNYLPKYGLPYFCRIRECMQYAKTLGDCSRIMREDNAGDYPCGWLLGDLNTNEIMLLEVAKTVAEPRRTNSGVFYGSNIAQDPVIRETQTTHGTSQPSMDLSVVARSNRLDWLLNNKYWGKLDAKLAKLVISDHYDSYDERICMGTRSICKHGEVSVRKPSKSVRKPSGSVHKPSKSVRKPSGSVHKPYPFGAIDGKVVTSEMAKDLKFWGRWGSSCGRVYNPSRTIKKHFPNVPNFRNESWTILQRTSKID
jgi:hypothetical protein